MKRRWFLATILVGVLTLVLAGGAVMARANGTGGESISNTLASRVAAILELDEVQVQEALDQAAKELRRERQDQASQQRLNRLVEQGRLTQQEADEQQAWYESRPEGRTPRLRFAGRQGSFGGMMPGGRRWHRSGFRHGFHWADPAPETTEPSS